MNILEMAMAAKMGGGGTGPIDPKRLPEGYPYKEKSEKALFEEVQIPDNQEYNKWVHTEHVPLVVGNKYKFTYNGVDYICTAADPYGQFVGIGNLSIANSGEDTGEPFVALSVNGMPLNIFFKGAQVGPGSFCLYEYAETIHTMAPEFLPAGVGGGTMVVNVVDGVVSHTAAEIMEYVLNGGIPFMTISAEGAVLCFPFTGMAGIAVTFGGFYPGNYREIHIFSIADNEGKTLCIEQSGTITMDKDFSMVT